MQNKSKTAVILELITAAEANLRSAKQMLYKDSDNISPEVYAKMASELPNNVKQKLEDDENNIIEGIFNGQTMINNAGEEYPVPANYASKSKLVPGDLLKLTIKQNGAFLYKQIGPVEREQVIGTLTYEDGQYKVIANGKAYKVILASVTYFKGEVGDKVTLIIPKMEESEWGSIENIIPNEEAEDIDIEA